MSAITSIPSHYTTEFEANWNHKVQQAESRLKEYVTIRNYTGDRMRCNLVDASGAPSEITERAGSTRRTDLGTELRWINTKGYEDAKLIDEWDGDLLGTVSAPDGEVLKAMMKSFYRNCDERIIEAVSGVALTGDDGTTQQAFDTTNQSVAVDFRYSGSGNTNLTVDKLIKTKSLFGKNEVTGQSMAGGSEELVVMAVTQAQLDSLLLQTEVTSTDYNTVKALVQGTVDTFMGIKFIRTELLSVASSIRSCYAWVKSGVKFSQGDHRIDIDKLPDQSHAHQVRVRCRNGGVRMEEKKAVRILCDENGY